MTLIDQAKAFFAKFSDDWCMNLAGLLAYNFLTAIFPLLLAILAVGAMVLPDSIIRGMAGHLNSFIAAGAAGGGAGGFNLNFYDILLRFRQASGITLIISLVGLIWTGANLFGVMENCFSIVFRTRDRDFIHQKIMAMCMIAIFAVLAPLSVFASSISGSFNSITKALGNLPGIGFVFGIGGYLIGVLFAFILFEIIYLVVPNLEIEWKDTWRGALVAAVLFEIINLVFPFYVKSQHSQFGNYVGLLAILTFWFWVLSLILLIGAELNSFAALGQRAAGGDLPTLVHDVQVHGQVPRAGEDADAPPSGHPKSAEGQRRHAETRNEKTATGEKAAHQPQDQDVRAPIDGDGKAAPSARQQVPAPARRVRDRASAFAATRPPAPVNGRDRRPSGGAIVGALAALGALLALLHRARHAQM